MEIVCEHCQKEFTVPIKKSIHRADKIHKMVTCDHCGRKNFVSVIQELGREHRL
jgi:DNA-directed RNA polymerase subunit RPC12/RpoP